MRSKRFPKGLIGLAVVLSLSVVANVPLRAAAQCNASDQQLAALESQLFDDGQEGTIEGDACPYDANGDGSISAADLTGLLLLMPTAPSPTPTASVGPVIVTFTLAGADGTVFTAEGAAGGMPMFQRAAGFGSGFQLVLEAVPGSDGAAVGTVLFNWNSKDPTARPDLQIEASRSLGDGDLACAPGAASPA